MIIDELMRNSGYNLVAKKASERQKRSEMQQSGRKACSSSGERFDAIGFDNLFIIACIGGLHPLHRGDRRPYSFQFLAHWLSFSLLTKFRSCVVYLRRCHYYSEKF
jgi:hypothetical protein